MENLDRDIKLGAYPGFILLVGVKGFILLSKKVEVSESGFVICEGDIISLPSFRLNWCWPPKVTMHLPSKLGSSLSSSHFFNRFPGRFCINTRLAEERITLVSGFQAYPCHETLTNQFSGNFGRNMAHSTMELIQRKFF